MTHETYWKLPFEWRATAPPRSDTLPSSWSWRDGETSEAPEALVAQALASSRDLGDQRMIEELGAEETARRTLALSPGFSYLPERWQTLYVENDAAGFVLPVLYDDCARDGLDEATIYHTGVAPAHRGRGIGRLLLRHATRLLVTHGVWRIYCDTAVGNDPMIHLFESEGWARLPDHEQPLFAA